MSSRTKQGVVMSLMGSLTRWYAAFVLSRSCSAIAVRPCALSANFLALNDSTFVRTSSHLDVDVGKKRTKRATKSSPIRRHNMPSMRLEISTLNAIFHPSLLQGDASLGSFRSFQADGLRLLGHPRCQHRWKQLGRVSI